MPVAFLHHRVPLEHTEHEYVLNLAERLCSAKAFEHHRVKSVFNEVVDIGGFAAKRTGPLSAVLLVSL